MIKYQLRGIEEGDLNFIFNSWLKSYRKSDFAKKVPSDVYYYHHKGVIDRLLSHSSILVACNPDNPAQVFGYIVASHEPILAVHYVYVKYNYRKLGLGKALAEALIPDFCEKEVLCTHANYYWRELSDKYALVFNPYI